MTKIVYIEKTEFNAIAICRDHYNGIAVQIIRFVDELRPGPDGTMVNFKTHKVLSNQLVPFVDTTNGNSDDFKSRVAAKVQLAREKLANIKKSDEGIEGVLNDYLSSHKGINEDGQKE